MLYEADGYSFELPDRWEGIVGVGRNRLGGTFKLLWEKGRKHNGVLATLKKVKRPDYRIHGRLRAVPVMK